MIVFSKLISNEFKYVIVIKTENLNKIHLKHKEKLVYILRFLLHFTQL